MANTAITGFIPSRVLGGGTITYRLGRVLTNNTTAIFKFDAVKLVNTGDFLVASATNTAVANVATGAIYTDANGRRIANNYLPAATLYTSTGVAPDNQSQIYMVEDPIKTEFKASVTEAIALTDLNLNYAMTLGAGSTTTGLSGHCLTSSGSATTNTIPWRVTEFVLGSVLSDPDLANATVYCRINAGFVEPALSANTGT